MTDLFLSWLLASSLGITAVLAFRPLVRRLAGPRTAYMMWWAPPVTMACAVIPMPDASGELIGSFTIGAMKTTASTVMSDVVSTNAIWLALLWLLPAFIAIALETLRYGRWRRKVESSVVAPEGTVLRLWREIAPRGCELRVSAGVSGPVVTGVLRPRVYLPMDFHLRYSPCQQRMILIHELAHTIRRDSAANALAFGMRWLFWFNPLAHLAYGRFRIDQEIACDAIVLGKLPKNERKAYAGALVRSVSESGRFVIAIPMHPLRQQLEERLIMLFQHQKYSRRTRTACLTAVGITTAVLGWSSAIGTDAPAHDAEPTDVTVVHREPPRYPADAAKQGIEGHVTVEFQVLKDGSVDDIQIKDSQPLGVFDEVTIEALAQWRFAHRDSPRYVTQVFEYELDE